MPIETAATDSIEIETLPASGIARRSFLKTCGVCAGALALGTVGIPGVASATDHVVYLGQNKHFGLFNYSFEDPVDFDCDGDIYCRYGTAGYAANTHFIDAHAKESRLGHRSKTRMRWGQTFPVRGTGSQAANVTVVTSLSSNDNRLTVARWAGARGVARAYIRVWMKDLTAKQVVYNQIVYEKKTTDWTVLDWTDITTVIPVTLTGGHKYRVFAEFGVSAKKTRDLYEVGTDAYVLAEITNHEYMNLAGRVLDISVAF